MMNTIQDYQEAYALLGDANNILEIHRRHMYDDLKDKDRRIAFNNQLKAVSAASTKMSKKRTKMLRAIERDLDDRG
jgi:hypothetical protein